LKEAKARRRAFAKQREGGESMPATKEEQFRNCLIDIIAAEHRPNNGNAKRQLRAVVVLAKSAGLEPTPEFVQSLPLEMSIESVKEFWPRRAGKIQ
jgi:hypothetical protein